MFTRLRKAIEEREEGFTLIELLVVVIIIGILAAIAIPVFLSQRKKGYDAQAKSDVRNAATAEEAYLTDTNTYTTTKANLTDSGFKPTSSVQLWGAINAGLGYCLVSHNSNSSNYFAWDSSGGGLQTPASPYTTLAAAEGACSIASPTWASVVP